MTTKQLELPVYPYSAPSNLFGRCWEYGATAHDWNFGRENLSFPDNLPIETVRMDILIHDAVAAMTEFGWVRRKIQCPSGVCWFGGMLYGAGVDVQDGVWWTLKVCGWTPEKRGTFTRAVGACNTAVAGAPSPDILVYNDYRAGSLGDVVRYAEAARKMLLGSELAWQQK